VTPGPSASPPPSPGARLLRGYGPLLAFVVLFTLMAAFVPTVGEEVRTVTVSGPSVPGGNPSSPAGGASPSQAADGPDVDGAPSPSTGTTATGSPAGGGAGARSGPAPAGSSGVADDGQSPTATGGPAAPVPGTPRPCVNRTKQVPNDPYSPPCIAFSGDNGGATSKGVTGTDIVVSARIGGLPDFSQAPSDSGPAASFRIKPDEVKRTMEGLAEYFNARFQFYGRKIKLAFFEGKGSFTTELQGGGQEQVEADAVKVADELKAFAELNGFTAPFGDALARRGVISFGAPYMSAEWLAQRRPYIWSPATDCTFIQESVSDYVNKRLASPPATPAAPSGASPAPLPSCPPKTRGIRSASTPANGWPRLPATPTRPASPTSSTSTPCPTRPPA